MSGLSALRVNVMAQGCEGNLVVGAQICVASVVAGQEPQS